MTDVYKLQNGMALHVGRVRNNYNIGDRFRLSSCVYPLIVVQRSDHGLFCMYPDEIKKLVNPPEPAQATTADRNLRDLADCARSHFKASMVYVGQYENDYKATTSTVFRLIARLTQSVCSDQLPENVHTTVIQSLMSATAMAAALPYHFTDTKLPDEPSYMDYMKEIDIALDAYDSVKNTRYMVGNMRRLMQHLHIVLMPYSA